MLGLPQLLMPVSIPLPPSLLLSPSLALYVHRSTYSAPRALTCELLKVCCLLSKQITQHINTYNKRIQLNNKHIFANKEVCCLWSTSRNKLWIKGETSGDVLGPI